MNPIDQLELNEILATLHNKHGWPIQRQVLTDEKGEAKGAFDSIGLSTHALYLEARIGTHRDDVSVTPWQKDVMI